jgi:hypothetical protein
MRRGPAREKWEDRRKCSRRNIAVERIGRREEESKTDWRQGLEDSVYHFLRNIKKRNGPLLPILSGVGVEEELHVVEEELFDIASAMEI